MLNDTVAYPFMYLFPPGFLFTSQGNGPAELKEKMQEQGSKIRRGIED